MKDFLIGFFTPTIHWWLFVIVLCLLSIIILLLDR